MNIHTISRETDALERLLNAQPCQDGIPLLSEVTSGFGALYEKVREKEKRIYPDEEVGKLPFASPSNPHQKEWLLRANSFRRVKKYIEKKKHRGNVLELGCGNGWFSPRLARNSFRKVTGLDIFREELLQAKRIFRVPNLEFCFGNIFNSAFPEGIFRMIFLNSTIQYFPDLHRLIRHLFMLLAPGGEIHILDSPLYKKQNVIAARERSIRYFQKLGFPEMAGFYHHHPEQSLEAFQPEYLYRPGVFKRLIKPLYAPFPWIRIRNEDQRNVAFYTTNP